MKLVIPNARRINRGGHDIKGIIEACKSNGVYFLELYMLFLLDIYKIIFQDY